MIKSGTDKLINTALIFLFSSAVVFPFLFFLPFPPADAWLFLTFSVVIHLAYLSLIAHCYHLGDYSLAYPAMRGSAPIFVLLMDLAFINEGLSLFKYAAVISICSGLGLLTLSAVKHSKNHLSGKMLLFAFLNGFVIACYTVNDGYGARITGSSLSYCFWFFFLNGPIFLAFCSLIRGRDAFLTEVRADWKNHLFGAILCVLCYSMVLWVITTAPMASVSALRETSVLFAALIGVLFFKESFGIIKTAACLLTAVGIILMKL